MRETEPARWRWLYRARSLAAAGVPLAGGSDAPDRRRRARGSGWRRRGRVARPTARCSGARERLDAPRARSRSSRRARRDALARRRLGRLVVGGPADLIVVAPDPLRAPPDEVAATAVRLTLIGGEIAWHA